ncbi:uncharacterized protein LOC134181149 isoform X2 [Corticium candelabrum]|nr:uncharacterized protein LOC134181149 isoform X2 [Corticium candelabrum]
MTKVSHAGETPKDIAVRRKNKKAIELLDRIDSFIKGQTSNASLQRLSSSRIYSRSQFLIPEGRSLFGLKDSFSRMSLSGVGTNGLSESGIGACASIPEAFNMHVTGQHLQLSSDMILQRGKWRGGAVLVKKPHPDKVNPQLIRMLYNEVHILGQLHHPNVIMLMAVCNSFNQDEVCMALEPMKRATLTYQLHERKRRFSAFEVLMLLTGIADGLYYVHESGFVHSYVKPDSILIGTTLQAKLCNFEFARSVDRASMSHVSEMFPYMAPEQLQGMPVDQEGDIYSFGCVLWECLTSRIPWSEKDILHLPEWVGKKNHRLQLERAWPVSIKRLLSATFGSAKSRPNLCELSLKLSTIAELQSPNSVRQIDDPFSGSHQKTKSVVGMTESLHHGMISSKSVCGTWRGGANDDSNDSFATTSTIHDPCNKSYCHETSSDDEMAPPTAARRWKKHGEQTLSSQGRSYRRRLRQNLRRKSRDRVTTQNDVLPGWDIQNGVSSRLETRVCEASAKTVDERGGSANDEDRRDHENSTDAVQEFSLNFVEEFNTCSEGAENVSCEVVSPPLQDLLDALKIRKFECAPEGEEHIRRTVSARETSL